MYCGGEVVVKDAIQLAIGRVKDSTPITPIHVDRAGAIVMIGGGVLCLVIGIPVAKIWGLCGAVFILAALLLFIFGLSAFANPKKFISAYQADCPYCSSVVKIENLETKGIDCPACLKRSVIREMKLISVDSPVGVVKRKD